MLSYNTGIQASPPITPAMQQAALDGLRQQKVAYPGPGQDVYNAQSQKAAVDMERWAAAQNNQHMQNAQQGQSDMALRGLQQMAQAQQNANNLATQRQAMQLDFAGQMMGGVNGLLSGLFQ
jgi:hypothetical protein